MPIGFSRAFKVGLVLWTGASRQSSCRESCAVRVPRRLRPL